MMGDARSIRGWAVDGRTTETAKHGCGASFLHAAGLGVLTRCRLVPWRAWPNCTTRGCCSGVAATPPASLTWCGGGTLYEVWIIGGGSYVQAVVRYLGGLLSEWKKSWLSGVSGSCSWTQFASLLSSLDTTPTVLACGCQASTCTRVNDVGLAKSSRFPALCCGCCCCA
jgi:hypothetical protein